MVLLDIERTYKMSLFMESAATLAYSSIGLSCNMLSVRTNQNMKKCNYSVQFYQQTIERSKYKMNIARRVT